MSLLMDALKRAEKARQAEVSTDGANSEPSPRLSLDPIDEPNPRATDDPAAGLAGRPEDTAEYLGQSLSLDEFGDGLGDGLGDGGLGDTRGHRSSSSSLSLEDSREFDLSDSADDLNPQVPPDPFPQPRSDSGDTTAMGLSLREGDEEDLEILEDTSATLPSRKSARASVSRYFDGNVGSGSGSTSLTLDDLQAALGEEQARILEEQISRVNDTDAQRQVRAVFHAQEASRLRGERNWVVIGLVPVLVLCLLAVGSYVFWDPVRDMLFGEAPQLARRQPALAPTVAANPTTGAAQTAPDIPVAAAFVETARALAAEQGVELLPRDGAQAPEPAVGSQVAPEVFTEVLLEVAPEETSGSGAGVAAETPELAATAPAIAPSAIAGTGDSAEAGNEASLTSVPIESVMLPTAQELYRTRTAAPETASQTVLNPLDPRTPTGFEVSRSPRVEHVSPGLSRAYEAFQSGDYAAAQTQWERVLRRESTNRDALLGLAALAVRKSQTNQAAELYARILRLNPVDSVAQASLIALAEHADPALAQGRIKTLLREHPEAAYLHFTLGNLFAQQDRWREAQGAYFDAFRLDDSNPDYAYNLAVSLDQLVKSDSALKFYRRALELAENGQAEFEFGDVLARIEIMTRTQ